MKRLTVALVGCGDIAFGYDRKRRHEGIHTHCAALSASERFHLAAVCDTQRTRAEECARAFSVPAIYDSIEALVTHEKADVLVACTPDKTHTAIGHAALTIPGLLALVMEKPLATNTQEADALLAAAREKNVAVAVNYSRRYTPGIQQLQKRIRGERLRAINGYYTKGVRHNGTHWLDLAELLGGPIRRLSANHAFAEVDADPTLDIHLEFVGGHSGFLKGCVEGEYSLFEMDILTDHGRYLLTDFGHLLESYRAAESPTRIGYRELVKEDSQDTDLRQALPQLWHDLSDALEHGRAPLSNETNALRALHLAEMATRAANLGVALVVE